MKLDEQTLNKSVPVSDGTNFGPNWLGVTLFVFSRRVSVQGLLRHDKRPRQIVWIKVKRFAKVFVSPSKSNYRIDELFVLSLLGLWFSSQLVTLRTVPPTNSNSLSYSTWRS